MGKCLTLPNFVNFNFGINIVYIMTYLQKKLVKICCRNRKISLQVLGTRLLKLKFGRESIEWIL